jgi:ParB/RepB/Spo0J family partition protein
MTSGTFRSIDITTIIVDRGARQRTELTGIEELAESIRANGLINPILVQRDSLQLVAGERRLAACNLLGWTHIPAQYEDEVDPVELRILELEENVRRVDLSWQDNCMAVYDFHRLKASVDPAWDQLASCAALNMSPTDLSRKIGVARELVRGNTKVAEAPKYSTAVGITERAKERETEHALEKMKVQVKKDERPESILITDFNDWALKYDGPRFNFIHCDFPYGIGSDTFVQGAAPLHGGYSDTEDDYWRLLHTLRSNLSRVASDSCHLMFWFSMKYYCKTLEFLSTFFTINPYPLVWVKSDNSGIIPDPERGPRQIYETAFFGHSGDRKIVRAKSNAVSLPSEKDIHMSIKPKAMLMHFFEMFVDSNTRMLDPTCGSGSSLRAAEILGANYVLGLERNEEFALSARSALASQRNQRKIAP